MKTGKYLNANLITEGLPINDVQTLYHEFFYRKDYTWWRDVNPGDVVVDIGACVGFFTCHALDHSASRIVSVEPSKQHLKTLLRNVSDYYIDNQSCPVEPIHEGIGSTANHFENVFSDTESGYEKMSFLDLVVDYNIPKIDYLKIDCEGGEYGIFTDINFPYLRQQVKHIAVEFHLDAYSGCVHNWKKFRDGLLRKFDIDQVRFLEHEDREKAYDDNFLDAGDFSKWSSFMLYITNS